MKQILNIFLLLCLVPTVFSQEKALKEQALDEFKKEHYPEAIALLEQAVIESPKDAEIYYYLGWFNHYRAYDSRPLNGYDYSYSERIFNYLDKALELNPDYGDAKYFYGAECSGNAFLAMQNYDSEKLKHFYKLAYEKGAYPAWHIEFGKNFLMSCDENAIVFTGGNADFDICSYLQLCENFRTDITVIPIGNIDRPWYVSFLKKGLKNSVRSINIKLTEQQIVDIHPFKWKETIVSIAISEKDRIDFTLPDGYTMQWTVYPDLQSERMHSKMEGESAQNRTYLSPQRAVLLQIIEDNFSERPIYFSNFSEPTFYAGLTEFFQNCGLVSRLTPIKTKDSDYAFDKSKMEKLLTQQNLESYKDLKKNNIPRISGATLYGYGSSVLNLANLYHRSNNTKALEKLIQLYTKMLKIDFNPQYEDLLTEELLKLQSI